MSKRAVVLAKQVASKILILGGQKVILDTDLADLYNVEPRHLNQQVKRNIKRFPVEFRFQISKQESRILRSQNVISSGGHGGRRYLPFVFPEHGAIMAATVLNSERAIEMSIFVVLAFVRMRQTIAANRQIMSKLAKIESRLENHDVDIQDLIGAVRELMTPPPPNRRSIGFLLTAGAVKGQRKAS
ncbi:MAG TPA: ORF6N domain-containing protein [Terriglobales bacterium]|nr:ORF6N domain-containing protein [Terriglobales bacterium]